MLPTFQAYSPFYYFDPRMFWKQHYNSHVIQDLNSSYILKQPENTVSIEKNSQIENEKHTLSEQLKRIKEIEKKKRKIQKEKRKKRLEKQDDFEKKKQKKNRNLPSNIIKFFISFIYHHPLLQDYVKTMNNNVKDQFGTTFIKQIQKHIQQGQSYIRPKVVENICKNEVLNGQHSKIFRVLLKVFLIRQFPLIISAMSKFTKKQKLDHLKMGRKLLAQFITKHM